MTPQEMRNETARALMTEINRLTPQVTGKAFDPDWFLLRERLEKLEVMLNAGADALEETLLPIEPDPSKAMDYAKTLLPVTREDDVCFDPQILVWHAVRDSCRRGGVAYVLNGVLSAIRRIEVLESHAQALVEKLEGPVLGRNVVKHDCKDELAALKKSLLRRIE